KTPRPGCTPNSRHDCVPASRRAYARERTRRKRTTMPNIDITKPELIWPGKYDEQGNRVINRGVALPFQVVETIQEGRATREPGRVSDLFSAQPSGNDEWRNKLIWGDNLLVMASLLEERSEERRVGKEGRCRGWRHK